MVVSRSDSKRRKKEGADSLQESPKRTKVHAQRKFAQGSHLNSPVLTPVKDKDKTKYNGGAPPAELLPIKRPKTEQFVNFLCFRGSDMLPKSLEFFNEPSIPEPLGGDEDGKRDGASTSGGSSRTGQRVSDKHGDQAGGVAKAEARNKNKSKPMAAVQALKKKYQEQRMNKEKRSLTKLALKVKGKNMVRTRSAGPLEDKKPAASATHQKKPVRTSRLVTPVKTKTMPAPRKPVLRKHPAVVKRMASKLVTRGGLRSGGGLPPGSDEGIKTERKPRKFIKLKASPLKKSVKKPAVASSLSDFSSDDDQPLVKKQRVMSKASILATHVTTRSRLLSKPSTSQTTSSRPPRKTKEAATLFMEMLKKDLRSPDEEDDNGDAMSVESYENIPKQSERRGSKDSTETLKTDKKAPTKFVRKETKPNDKKLPLKNNRKLPEKPSSRLTSLKTRTLRRNSYRLVAKEMELKRLKSTRNKLLSRISSRSSVRDISVKDSSTEVEKTTPKGSTSERDSRRERRSNPNKNSESKSKLQKLVTKENEVSSSKVAKKKSTELTFDDSDEEPLGKKVNQHSLVKGLKKTKQISENKEISHADPTDFVEQKMTRRRSLLNSSLDSTKEELKQSAPPVVKTQHTSKSDIENENNGKNKPESVVSPKSGDNNSGASISKSKQIVSGSSANSVKVTQKPKESEKNSVQNKKQIENKGKKPDTRRTEGDKTLKPQEDNMDLAEKEKKPQAGKSVKKSNSKKSLDNKGCESDSTKTSKDGANSSEKKSITDSIPEIAINSDLKHDEENVKCHSSNKKLSKKNISLSNKGDSNNGNKNDLPSTVQSGNSALDIGVKSMISNVDSQPAGVMASDLEKVSDKSCYEKTPANEGHLDTKTVFENCQTTNKPALENSIQIMQKPDSVLNEKILSPPKCPDKTAMKQLSSGSKSVNEVSNVGSDIKKVEPLLKNEVESCKPSSPSKSNFEEINFTSFGILGRSSNLTVMQESKLPEGVEIPKNISLVKDLTSEEMMKDSQSNISNTLNNQNQPSTSLLKIKSNDKVTIKDLKGGQPIDSLRSNTNKSNEFEKLNEDVCNKQSNNSNFGLKNAIGEKANVKEGLSPDLNNKMGTGKQVTTKLQNVNTKFNEIAGCSKNVVKENENDHGLLTPKTFQPFNTISVPNLDISNNFLLQNKNSIPKDKGSLGETFLNQSTLPARQQPQQYIFNATLLPDDKTKTRNVVLESNLNKNLDVKCLPGNFIPVATDFKGRISEQIVSKETVVPTKGFQTDMNKSGTKEEHVTDNSSKLGSLDMSDKISSAVETLMSLKNVHKIDEKSFTIQPGVWNVKGGQSLDIEPKRTHEIELKHVDAQESKKIKMKEGEVKRVTIQEPEFKRFNLETESKRPNLHESEFKRFNVQDLKPKPEHPQVLKGCSNPKSMLKPGTLIDIAGISHSPEIMTPLRPGVDGEIIPMNKPIRPFGQEVVDPFKTGAQGFKPYEPRVEASSYGYRWQSPSSEKSFKSEPCLDKEVVDSKSKTSVNESAWRLAFKNVKDPKSSNNVPTEKPTAKKQLSVTALAKKHKSKTEVVNDKNTLPQSSTTIPFLRQNKPFLGPSPTKSKDAGPGNSTVKKTNTDVDPASLREKEAEVEEFLRQCGENSRLHPSLITPINQATAIKTAEDINRSSSSQSSIMPLHSNALVSDELTKSISEQKAGNQPSLTGELKYTPKKLTSHEQPEATSLLTFETVKRAGSPLKLEKRQTQPGPSETTPVNRSSLGNIGPQDQTPNKQNSSVSYAVQDQSLNIFQADSISRSNSPKISNQKSVIPGIDSTTTKFNDSSSVVSIAADPSKFLAGTQQSTSSVNISKQTFPDKARNFSPNRSKQSIVPDNLFRDSNFSKRTKSPTLMDSYPQQNSSPKGNSISRNTNSPVFGKCTTTNIFKEIVPARRGSPTFISPIASDSDNVPNLFSQNQTFRRAVSPLSNKSGFLKSGATNDNIEIPNSINAEEKNIGTCVEDSLKKCNSSSVKNSVTNLQEKPTTIPVAQTSLPLEESKDMEEHLTVKEEVVELEEGKSSNLTVHDGSVTSKQDTKPIIQGSNEKPTSSLHDIEKSHGSPGTSEAKHRLPLPVEQTLKKLGQTRPPQNKKTSLPAKPKHSETNLKHIQTQNEDIPEQVEIGLVGNSIKDIQSNFSTKLITGIYSHNQEEELDLMQKKKVNMSTEEIKRWLNDSSTSEVEHRANCGILENNTCECEYRNTLATSMQNIDTLKFENVLKTETISLNKTSGNQFDVGDAQKSLNSQVKSSNQGVEHSLGVKGKDGKDVKEIKKDLFGPETEGVSKQDLQKSASSSVKNVASNQLKEEGLVPITNFCIPVSVGSSGSPNMKQPPSPSPISKLRTFRLPNKNVEVEQKTTNSDILDVSTPARDDASSSNDLSSSNEETPDKSHNERKSIFHQRRSALKLKERRELIAPSVNAFSPENESSVYAFDPELPPTSTPFRRSKGKDGKSASTVTDDEELTPNSNSIAVQVNFDNEAVLECSTQTDVQEGDDDDTHTFYIPLQQSAADTNKPPLIQGVAVKVDTEGPDQKVIMRAKLVTKPLSTFNQSSSPRGLIGTRSGKPEQKVRPLSVKPPVGTVQPTARPKPKPPAQDEQPGPSKANTTCSPQAARLAKRIKSKAAVPSTSAENHPPKVTPAKLVEAPTFYPTEKEFEDPLEYISSITPQAEKYGLCRVVPPSNFKPECKVSDDMRFTAYNQYIHKMLHRWGPNVKEMLAIKKYLATQSIALTHPPWIGGMEVDLPRLYQTVQQCGGLKEVIEKKRWHRVADAMKIPKSAQDRVTKLDDIYCKFLLPYDTLSHTERTQLFEGVEKDWIEREKRVANQQDSATNDDDEDSDSDSDSDIDECIVKGRSMALNGFYRIARNTMSMWFPKTDTPSAADVELEFWKHVASRQHHVCVHSGSIDSGAMGYGFPTGKNSSTSRHPWNLKMLTNNPGSVLRFLGPIMGVTVPTLHVGMLFSACCWYRDPHGLPWIEYLHTGASKIWYGIPDSSSSQFRDAVMSIVPRLCRDKTLWLASDTAMVPPPLLVEKGVSLSRIVQDPGQFIVVFPKAFTSSVCTGYLVSESVYFAQPSWLSTAQALFNDMRESSEPTVFSLEKLLFSIVNDSRASGEVLSLIQNIVVSLRDGEVAGRRQLEELGLDTSERLSSRRKGKARPASDGEEDLECERCRMTLYISWMSNSQDGSVYCLPHAVELLSNKRSLVKHCTLVYAFSEEELEELVEKLKSRLENKNQKKSVAKGSRS